MCRLAVVGDETARILVLQGCKVETDPLLLGGAKNDKLRSVQRSRRRDREVACVRWGQDLDGSSQHVSTQGARWRIRSVD
jgi:hypothetical protein